MKITKFSSFVDLCQSQRQLDLNWLNSIFSPFWNSVTFILKRNVLSHFLKNFFKDLQPDWIIFESKSFFRFHNWIIAEQIKSFRSLKSSMSFILHSWIILFLFVTFGNLAFRTSINERLVFLHLVVVSIDHLQIFKAKSLVSWLFYRLWQKLIFCSVSFDIFLIGVYSSNVPVFSSLFAN